MVTAGADGCFKGHLSIQMSFTSAGTSHPRQILLRRSLAFVGHLEAGAVFLTRGELAVHVRSRLLPGPSPLSCSERHTGCQRPDPPPQPCALRPAASRLSPAPPTAGNRRACGQRSPQTSARCPQLPPAVSHTPPGPGRTRGAPTPPAAPP